MYSSEWQTAGNTELRTVLVRIQWDTQQSNPFSDWIRPYSLGCAPHYYWGSAKRGSWGIKRERKLICGSHNAFVIIIIARVEILYSTGYSDDKLMSLSLFPSHIAITNLVVGHTSILSSNSSKQKPAFSDHAYTHSGCPIPILTSRAFRGRKIKCV